MDVCPVCNEPILGPVGPTNSKVLIVVSKASAYDVRRGVPFSDRYESGSTVWQEETDRVGFNWRECRIVHLWAHPKPGKGGKECLDHHVNVVKGEMVGRKYVLLLGQESITQFLGGGVLEWSGLEMDLPDINILATAAPHPADVPFGVVGEFRLALEKFKRRTARLK